MSIQSNIDLKPFNTFGLSAKAAHFMAFHSIADLRAALKAHIHPVQVLGGGSNILFTGDVAGLLLKNEIKGIEVVRVFKNRVWVKSGGGEVWHPFVLWAVAQGFGGLENLSLIPGTVGAAPIQNIGAYGVELKDVFVKLEAFEWETGRIRVFTKKECRFGYRDSIFKSAAKGRYCILSVTFSLTRHQHRLNLSYGDIQKTLDAMQVTQPDIASVSRAVVHIRSSKLPDPAVIGNCGSFFKNPETERSVLDHIRVSFPHAPGYDLPHGRVKIPAGWLIEQCGWKGKRVGNAGCYEKQALVLVNHGGAVGSEVKQLAQDIIASVKNRFGVQLEPEVNIW